MNANIGFTSTKTYLVTLAYNLLSSQFVLNFWTAFMIMGLDRTYHTHQFTLHFSLHLQSILVCIFCSFCVVD